MREELHGATETLGFLGIGFSSMFSLAGWEAEATAAAEGTRSGAAGVAG